MVEICEKHDVVKNKVKLQVPGLNTYYYDFICPICQKEVKDECDRTMPAIIDSVFSKGKYKRRYNED